MITIEKLVLAKRLTNLASELIMASETYELVNLTPHAINISVGDEMLTVPPSSGGPARLSSLPASSGDISVKGLTGKVPLSGKPEYGPIVGLPDPVPGVLYIVSALIGAALSGRSDVVMPGTGPNDGAIRENGQIKAVTRLVRAG